MSSNDSTSSSRLSQFGLYRTIDARTEEFLKLSRRRQIRQGCACAAVSTAVTVTVVVSILILYGYGVGPTGAAPRPTSWLDLMNDSTDTTPFDDKFQNSVKFDQAGVNLLPVIFDKLLEDQDSSTQKNEFPTETNSKRNVFPGILGQAKTPTPGLYSIQYKTYPILYLQSPRNTEYYMKVRKTREYERVMSYIDKMINEKVGFGSRSIVNQQYLTSTTKNTETSWADRPRAPKTTRVITKPKESKIAKIILHSNNDSKQMTMSKSKFNNTSMYENKNCKCRNNFGTLLNKLIKCFQALAKDSSEQPCKNNTSRKTAIKVKNQGTDRPAPSTTSPVTTTRVRSVTTTTHSTTTTSTTKPSSTTTNDPKDDFNSTEFPAEIYHYSNNFFKKPALLNYTKIKPKGLLSQMSPFYVMSENTDSKIDIPTVNIFAPVKPKSNIFSTKKHKSKVKNNEQNDIIPITEKDFEETATSTSTLSPEKSEEIFQNLLFPETKDLEYARLPQKAVRKFSADYILRPRSHTRLPPVIKPNASTKPPTTLTPYNLIQYQTDDHYKVSTENIITKTTSSPYAPILLTHNRPYSRITPEDYIMERIRQKHKKQNKTLKSFEPLGHQREKNSNNSMFNKIKSLLKAKLMKSRLKSPYNRLSAKIMKSKTKPKYVEDKQTVLTSKGNITTKYTVENFTSPYVITKVYNRVTTSTTQIPVVLEGSTSPTQLKKYPTDIDPFLPDITTQSAIKESNYYGPFQKLERRNIPYVSREDIYADHDIYKPSLYDSPLADMKTTTETSKNNSSVPTTTDHVIDVNNSSMDSKEIHTAYVGLGLDKINSMHNTEKITWEPLKTDDNYPPYYKYTIPVGRKSYLEISRGDWKQKEPHTDDTNVMYDAFDDEDGL